MTELFIKLLNMSISASYLVLVILLIRFAFKKLPKAFVCVLWAFVAVRLLVPISFESNYSLVPSVNTVPENIMESDVSKVDTGIGVVNNYMNPILENINSSVTPEEVISNNVNMQASNENDSAEKVESTEAVDNKKPVNILANIMSVSSYVWVAGMVVMVLYAAFSYINIFKRISEAVLLKDNIWLCDRVKSPFILGIVRPKIILPSQISENEMSYVLAHENAHLKRHDHFFKPLGFLLLTVYWFNPLMWVAYIFLCKDIEMACDEKVIAKRNAEYKKAYTSTLLDYSISGRMVTACPLAFGESGVESRIKSVLSYKKPTFWIIVVAVLVIIGVGIGFLTNPKSEENKDINIEQDEDNKERISDDEVDIETLKKELLEKGYYEYPDTEGMHGNTIVEECRIPKEILDIMTTEQLAKAVIDYPMLMIHFASSQSFGTDLLQEACDAYKELLTREDAKEVLITQVKLHEVNVDSYVEIEFLKDIILDETKFVNILTDDDKDYLDSYMPDAKLLGYYVYPAVDFVVPDTGMDMCKISKKTVDDMTTEQLAQAVFDYPYISFLAEAIKHPNSMYYSKNVSDAYNEIVTRKDAKYELLKKALKYDGIIAAEYNVQAIKDILLYDNRLNGSWTSEEKDYLMNLQSTEKESNGISFKSLLIDISAGNEDEFKKNAINSESVVEPVGWTYPMQMFTTKKEFDDFYAEYKDIGDGLSSFHPKFKEVGSKYDEEFFKDNTLFIVYTYTGSYMIEEDVNCIYVDDKQFSVYIDVSKDPGMVDYGGGDYFILIEVDKDDIKGCTEFGAYNYPIEE